jgi:capsular polysaccharide biosynthesis protein
MTRVENDDLKEVRGEANTYEDEINLMDYFLVLWKRKWFISFASVLPALVVGVIIFLWPRDYKTTYLYDANLNEKEYRMLLDRFYCEENLGKIVAGLKEKGLEKYAQQITEVQRIEGLKKLVNLEVSPSFFGSASTKIEDLQKIQQARSTSLIMTIVGSPRKDMYTISSIMRDDFEKVVPIYSVQEELTSNIETFRTQMADIEGGRFLLGLELQKNKAILEKLKSVQQSGFERTSSNIILRFDAMGPNSSSTLPITYQIQAANSQIFHLEEDIRVDEEKFNYYKDLLSINEKILNEVKDKISSYYTIQEFRLFLDDVAKDYKDKKSVDYLDAYIKKIENKIANIIPITKGPKVYPVAKGTVKKGGTVFVISLTISVFLAFLLEGLEKNRVRLS